jgi:hypothetical protein
VDTTRFPYVALHTTVVTFDAAMASAGTELSDSRQATTSAIITGTSAVLTGFWVAGRATGLIKGVAFWDSLPGGNIQIYTQLDTPANVASNDPFIFRLSIAITDNSG